MSNIGWALDLLYDFSYTDCWYHSSVNDICNRTFIGCLL